jgi:hypothetical protein
VNPHHEFLRALVAALGLPGTVQKVVIEVEVGNVPKFYVRGVAVKPESLPAMVTAVKDVMVTDKAEVQFAPLIVGRQAS